MTNPWENLSSQLLITLKASISDFVDMEKPEVEQFLQDKAKQVAEQTWKSLNGSDEEKSEAISNLRHLKAQVIMEAAHLELVATTAAVKLLGKVFEVVSNVAIQYGVKLLASI